jgi:hypothetical protein
VNPLHAAPVMVRRDRIRKKALKIVLAHVPNLAELKCGQVASTRHALDLLGTAAEDFRQVVNVQHALFASHATLLFATGIKVK